MPHPSRFVVALVRHGEYEQPERVPSATLPHPLTATGCAQARELATTLRSAADTHALALAPYLDSSPLLRAWQTATIAAAHLSEQLGRELGVEQHADLCERSLGAAANLTIEQIADAVAGDPRLPPLPSDWKGHPRFRLPFLGAESLLQAGARVAAHLERRAHAHGFASPAEDRLHVVISHGGALRHAAVCLGILAVEQAVGVSMHHCGHVLVERLGDGQWTQIGGSWKLRRASGGGD
jgi:2,3-bisphosphoglycerate-dependent phosphoglycerate mutase